MTPPPPSPIGLRWARSRVFGLLIPLLALCSCAGYPTLREAAAEINKTRNSASVFLVPGDQVDVRIASRPEWNQVVIVRRDGRASFLFFDDIVVAGMTIEQLDKALTAKFAARPDLTKDAEITVNLTAVAPRTVVVTGEVGAPGAIAIERNHLSLVEALGRAGGFDKATARLTEVLLVRWMPNEGKLKSWWLDASVDTWGDGVPILLQAHDLIHVPNNTVDRINIWVDKWIRQNLPIPLGIPVGGS